MRNKNKEINILHRALEMLRKNTKLKAEIEINPAYPDDVRPDAAVKIGWADAWQNYDAEIKNDIYPAMLGGTVRQLELFHKKGILIARYVNPQMADELKKLDIPFVDTAGNMYINEPNLFIFIKGEKVPEEYRAEQPTRAFRPAGLQVIFALLCNPGLENEPFREIANKANVALGTIDWAERDLKKLDYLIELPKRNRRLIRKRELLNRWTTAYPEQLRPKKMIGLYKADDLDWWKNADAKDQNFLWGGELAAKWTTEYLKPQKITIYTNKPTAVLLLENKLKKDPNGHIELLEIFWNFKLDWGRNNTVPPLLIYADLLATGNPRNIETARIIYERELEKFIKSD